ncbi:MAG TPA: DUF2461 domain-containing protein [Flavobacteriales bacterium]|nr:DUF2461 domain-containing protein [Flavobacteriales bacterium]
MSDIPYSIQPYTFKFLKDLAKHDNDRDWFEANRPRYQAALENVRAFADALIERMNRHDKIATANGKEAIFRIYSNRRFRPDRPLYKQHMAGGLDRMKPALRGGYYFHIKPGECFIGCGFWDPESEDLRRIRMDMLYEYETWNKILRGKNLRSHWGEMEGDQLKTAPQGFPKDHPATPLLRFKQLTFSHDFTDKEVMAPGFVDVVNTHFKAIRPWFDHLSEVLTTDDNGESLLS